MTLSEALVDLLPRLTYKPGTSFLTYMEDDQVVVELRCAGMLDATGGEKPLDLRFTRRFPNTDFQRTPWLAADAALTCVDLFLTSYEEHEKHEWLRVDGRLVTDSHRLGLVTAR